MVNKKMTMRDYYRGFITKANKEAGVTYNASKLNSKEECEEYLLNLIKNLRHKAQPQKVKNSEIMKENKSLKNEVENLKADKELYIMKAENATKSKEEIRASRDYFSQEANLWKNDFFNEKDKHNSTKVRLEDFMVIVLGLGIISIVEAVSIAILAWK